MSDAIADLLRAHRRVVAACHEGADGDAIGSLRAADAG